MAQIRLANSQADQLKFDAPEVLVIPQGSNQTLWTRQNASSYQQSGQTHMIQQPSLDTCLDPRLYWKNKIRLTFTGTTPDGSNLLKAGLDAPTAFPMISSVNNLNLSINNSSATAYHAQTLQAYLRMGETPVSAEAWSLAPTMLDKQQNFNDSLNVSAAFEDLVGNENNSLSKGPVDSRGMRPRGNYWYTIEENTPTSAKVVIDTLEPLMMTPFTATEGKNPLTNIDKIQFTFNFNNPTRFWSHNATAANASKDLAYTWDYVEAPSLYYQQFQHPTPEDLPPIQTFPFAQHNYITTAIPDAFDAPGSTALIQTNSYNLSKIPDAIYVYAERTEQYKRMSDTNTYAFIESIEFQFDTQSAMNTGLTEQQQWIITRDSGVGGTFQDQTLNTGTIVRVIPGITFPFQNPAYAPGVVGNHTLTMKVKIRNIDRNVYNGNPVTEPLIAPRKWNLVTIYQEKSIMEISENRMRVVGSVLTEDMVLQAREGGIVVENIGGPEAEGKGMCAGYMMPLGMTKMTGGKIKWKKLARQAWKGAKSIGLHKPIQRIGKAAARTAVGFADRLADRAVDAIEGIGSGFSGGNVSARPSQSLPQWSEHVGGALVSRQELEQNAAVIPQQTGSGFGMNTPAATFTPIVVDRLDADMMEDNPF